jgi:hypothetical protein
MSKHYEQAAADLKRFLEDLEQNKLEDEFDLQMALKVALTNRYLSRNVGPSLAEYCASDDALMVINNLDTLRPILEHWWRP